MRIVPFRVNSPAPVYCTLHHLVLSVHICKRVTNASCKILPTVQVVQVNPRPALIGPTTQKGGACGESVLAASIQQFYGVLSSEGSGSHTGSTVTVTVLK